MSIEKDRAMLKKISVAMHTKSAECHASGMTWAGQSARIEQFENIGSDEEVTHFLRLLIEEGMVDMVDGEPVIVDPGEPAARVDIRITSEGGQG